jgi:putative nucleotidyltransferase with HDIG domain
VSLFLNFRSVVHALSDALDLVGVNDIHHGKRVAIMCVDILRSLGGSEEELDLVFEAGMLHDIGVSSSDLHRQLVEDFDWEGSQSHAEFGAYLLRQFPPLAHLAPAIRLHHTHWSLLRQDYDHTALIGNLIFLTDRIDVLAAVAMLEGKLLEKVPEIRAKITAESGEMFDPQLVEAFLDVSRKDSFWLDLEPDAVRDRMEDMLRQAPRSETDITTLRGVATLFSHVVDAKSRFTVEHSEAVARLAIYLAHGHGLDDEGSAKLEIAGYLHDLGKLRVPDGILDKPGPLNAHERRQIASHAYETYRILSRIPGFEEIAHLAANHHEIPNGEGYPFRLKGEELTLSARLLRAADIFQALVQERPYRGAMPARQVLDHMLLLTETGLLDRAIYDFLAAHLDDLYRLAGPQTVEKSSS